MPPDAGWVRSWLTKAEADLLAATKLLAAGPCNLYAVIAFHAQQCVEKCLKAFLVYHDVEFEKVHVIRYLLDMCEETEPKFQSLRNEAEPLTRYAVTERYPAPGPDVNPLEAASAVVIAKKVRDFVLSRLPGAVHPNG